jgi:MoxR-like ATPase
MRLSAARAALKGRDFVLPDDIKEVAVPALAHRLILAADPWIRGVKPQAVVESILRDVPVPKVD